MDKYSRWAFSAKELTTPANCNSNDELIAYIDIDDDGDGAISFGIIVYRDGEASNRFDSGIIGVPNEFITLAEDCESLIHSDGLDTDVWRDVKVDDTGNFICFLD